MNIVQTTLENEIRYFTGPSLRNVSTATVRIGRPIKIKQV